MPKSRLARPRRYLPWGVFAFVGTLLVAGPLLAQPRTATKFYPDFSDMSDALLRNASSHIRDGQWAEAIEIYQRVIQQYGDKVAKLPNEDPASDRTGESMLYVDLRRFCQRQLAALPPEGLEIYRRRVDEQAERWYQQGKSERDVAPLQRVVGELFCSSWGDDALDLLGDLCFEQGRFDEALAYYRQLVPDPGTDRSGLTYPSPTLDLARVAAKKFLCHAALGNPAPTEAEVDAYAKTYPDAAGALAGRTGPYLKTLKSALESDQLAPPPQLDGRWPTFAGSPTRTRVIASPVDVGSLQWRVSLPAIDLTRRSQVNTFGPRMGTPSQPKVSEDRLLAYHPILVGDQVIVGTQNKVLAFNLNERPGDENQGAKPQSIGVEPAWEAPPDPMAKVPRAQYPSTPIPRYTLTTQGDRIYARLGPPASSSQAQASGTPSRIIALDRRTEGKVLWSVNAGQVTLPGRAADRVDRLAFEGTPVANGESVFVALTERREQTSTYVLCLNADNGDPRWVRYVGAASDDADVGAGFGFPGVGMGVNPNLNDLGHRLLSLDGSSIYYQTNLGAVVALDAVSGTIRWVASYPRLDRSQGGARQDRDLNPAVVHEGRVIVAPDDSSRIYAFDAETGRLLWKTNPLPAEVRLVHLLGVAKGRVIATGNRVLAFDVKTGELASAWPDSGHAYAGFGRGVLAGDRIYWPTRSEIHVLDQETVTRAEPSIKLQESFQTSGGNLVVGDGYLVVAQADALVVFCQNSRLIQRYRDAIALAPNEALNYFRLARAAEATGQDELAIASLNDTLSRVRPTEQVEGRSLADTTRDHQYRILIRLGRKAMATEDWKQAHDHYVAATRAARADRERLTAKLALAEVYERRGDPVGAVEILQSLLAQETMRRFNLPSDDGHRMLRAELHIGDRLSKLVQEHGRAVYQRYDEEARSLLRRGQSEKSPRLFEEVGKNFPVAEVVPESLLELGQLRASLDQPIESAQAFRRLQALAPDESTRARALWGLAQAYEAQKLWVSARDTYLEIRARFADQKLGEGPDASDTTLASLVTSKLASPPFQGLTADRPEPDLPIPLVRRWSRSLDQPYKPLSARGEPPSTASNRIFLSRDDALSAIDPTSGSLLWSVELGGTPRWVGYLTDKLVAATDNQIVALSVDTGTPRWKHAINRAILTSSKINPFAQDPQELESNEGRTSGLHGFQIVGNRLFVIRGDQEILALDGDSGETDWSFTAGQAKINPHVLITERQILLQVLEPNSIVVLETKSGLRKGAFPHTSKEGWLRSPLPLDDEQVVIVPDRRSVALFNLRKGISAWVFRESDHLPSYGPPRVIGTAETLLVIHDGTELIRLDSATGTKRWSTPLGSSDLSERLASTLLDNDRFYWAGGHSLNALSLDDGALSWSSHLAGPHTEWALALTERCVLAYPMNSVKFSETEEERGDQPNVGEGLTLLFRRRESGTLLQRVYFPVLATDVVVRLAPDGAMVATRDGYWALGHR